MTYFHILYCMIGASLLLTAGCHPSGPPVNVKLWTSSQRSLYAGAVFYEGPPRSYPEHAVAFYHVAGTTIDEDQVTKNFGEGMAIIRHDFGQQYAKQKIAWDASKWSRDREPQPNDFTSVRGIVIGLVPHDQPPADEDDHDSHLEYIVILDLDVVFDESRTVEDVVRDAVVHRNSFHRSYDEKTRRFISKIDALETQAFKDAVEKDKGTRTP